MQAPESRPTRRLRYDDAVREALVQCMESDPGVIVLGEGVPDPRAIFGTTRGLRERFGAKRVLDTPLSEAAMTGLGVGAALAGLRPVLVHQRVDFALLAMDQLVNNAAKWHYMFGGQQSVPLVVRLVVGRGWGQGPQHSQSLQALFAHVPGLRVVLPASPSDAKGLLTAAIRDPNPVLMIEHRWLHALEDEVAPAPFTTPLGEARIARPGRDVTVAAFSYMVVEALEAARHLEALGIQAEVIDLRCASPLDADTVVASVRRTRRLAVLDTGWRHCGLAGELVARVCETALDALATPPLRITLPDAYVPASPQLAADYYPTPDRIAGALAELVGGRDEAAVNATVERARRRTPLDVPYTSFTGPF
ncbi:MAG: alpha-ketoacid dehydrogenase subunit beta [Proteobacteria bacterium]|nr:alpha-ketoacid dehydrogenase subunit beta [Pseudomonadota bacterium]